RRSWQDHPAWILSRAFGPFPEDLREKRHRRRHRDVMQASAAASCAGFRLLRWNTARALLFITLLLRQRDAARALLHAALCFFSVNRNAAERVKRLPGDSLRILDPVLVRFGIAARSPGLVQRRDAGFGDLLAQIFQLLVGFHLESQVVKHVRSTASRNGEVNV